MTHPGYLSAVVLTLALGIGAATAMFSAVNAVLLGPMGVDRADRVVVGWGLDPQRSSSLIELMYNDVLAIGAASPALKGAAGVSASTWPTTVEGAGEPLRLQSAGVSGTFFDILQAFMGYRTCYYRTFNVGRATPVQHDAYKKAREWLDGAIALIRPGVTTDKVCSVWPKAPEFGFPDEMAAFGLQFGHGLGLNLHERPIISRVVSMDYPMEIKTGMVFALETYCPAKDGFSAARIEEEIVVTDKGGKVISLFPAEELPIANEY